MHKDVICRKSKYFARLRSSCQEEKGEETVVCLHDVDAGVFQSYVELAYRNTLVIAPKDSWSHLYGTVELYLFGNTFEDVKLRNETLRAFSAYVTRDKVRSGVRMVQVIWDHASPSLPIRNWLLDEVVMRFSRAYLRRNVAEYPEEFVQAIAVKLMEERPPTTREALYRKFPRFFEVETNV